MLQHIQKTASAAYGRIQPYLPSLFALALMLAVAGFGYADYEIAISEADATKVDSLFQTIKTWVVVIAVSAAGVVIVISGAQMIFAGATNPKLYDDAKDRIKYAVIGLLVIGFTNTILNLVHGFLRDNDARIDEHLSMQHAPRYVERI